MENHGIESIVAQLRDRLQVGDLRGAVAVLEALRPADRADAFEELSPEEQDVLLSVLDTASAADIFEDMEDRDVAEAALRMDSADLAPIVDEMVPDEAADLLGDLPAETALEVIEELREPDDVRPLLLHPDETAGGLMTSEFIVLRPLMTASEALRAIGDWGPEREDLFYYYVADRDARLIGVTSLLHLVRASPGQLVQELMDRDVVSVTVDADQEECARLMSRYDLISLPVTDNEGRIVGVITVDDLVDVIEDEATEDIQRLGGAEPLGAPYLDVSPLVVARKRVLWLLMLFVTETLTGTVLRMFEAELQSAVALAFFVPLLIGTGGNAGSQTVSTIIRALSVGDVSTRDFLKAFWHEARVGVLLGLCMAVAGFVRAEAWGTGGDISLAVGISLLTVVMWANCVGAALPMAAARLRIDPAIVSGPLMSTLVDATGLLIYFRIAKAVLGI